MALEEIVPVPPDAVYGFIIDQFCILLASQD